MSVGGGLEIEVLEVPGGWAVQVGVFEDSETALAVEAALGLHLRAIEAQLADYGPDYVLAAVKQAGKPKRKAKR